MSCDFQLLAWSFPHAIGCCTWLCHPPHAEANALRSARFSDFRAPVQVQRLSIMETSLRLNAEDRSLVMHAKENFVSDGNIALQVHAKLNTQTGKPSCLIQLKKKFFPEVLTSIDVGAKVDVESREVTYSIQGKKTWELTDNGLLCLDLKGAYNYQPHTQSGKPKASVELSQKVFNFTEDQDLKVKLGYNVVARKPYLQLRENNWTLNAELRETAGKRIHWSIAYDL